MVNLDLIAKKKLDSKKAMDPSTINNIASN